MSEYATRRDAKVRDTLTAIDEVTAPRCHTCGAELSPNGPSPLFCGQRCQERGLESQADDHLPERWRGGNVTIDDFLAIPAPAPSFARLYLNNPISSEALSVTNATVRSMDAIDEETARRAAAQHRRDQADHAFHRREGRGGYALWVQAAAVAIVGSLLAATGSWTVAVVSVIAAAGAAWIAWVSVGNARAAAKSCPICHPPCDTTA